MARDVLMVGDHLQRLVAHVLGVGGGETDTHIRSRLGHHRQQTRKVYRLLAVGLIAVGVHVLAQKRRLLEATGAQVSQFAENRLRLARALTSACIRNDTVGTEIVTAAHDTDESADLSSSEASRHHVAVCLGRAQVDVDRLLAVLGRRHEIREVQI